MNTPSHAILNLVLSKKYWIKDAKVKAAIVWGALLPDIPMFFFWGICMLFGYSQRIIWDELYFHPQWQAVFNLFNSIPIALIILALGWRYKKKIWMAFSSSMILHCITDLIMHTEDAHAHFFPASNWKFIAPFSYWDPAHGGQIFSIVEALGIAFCAYLIYPTMKKWWSKALVIGSAAFLFVGHIMWYIIFNIF